MPLLDPTTTAQLLNPQPIGGRPPPPFFQQQQVPMPPSDPRGSTFATRFRGLSAPAPIIGQGGYPLMSGGDLPVPLATPKGMAFDAGTIPTELLMHNKGYPIRPDKNVYSPYDIMNVILKVNPFKQAKA